MPKLTKQTRSVKIERETIAAAFDLAIAGEHAALIDHLQSFAASASAPRGIAFLTLLSTWAAANGPAYAKRDFAAFIDEITRQLLDFVEMIVPLYDHARADIPEQAGILTDRPDRPRNILAALNCWLGFNTKRGEFIKAMREFGKAPQFSKVANFDRVVATAETVSA